MKYINPSVIKAAAVGLGVAYETARRYLVYKFNKTRVVKPVLHNKIKMKGFDFIASAAAGLAPLRTIGGDIPMGTSMPTGVINSFNGPIVQTYGGKRKWGRPQRVQMSYKRLCREMNLNTTKINYRFQSIAKFDNQGCSSIPLMMTAKGDTAGNEGELAGSGTEKLYVFDKYTIIYFPFFVMNLTSLPGGKMSVVDDENFGSSDCDSFPFYQLYKDTTTGNYGWRPCCGLNNASIPNRATYGIAVAGTSNGTVVDQLANRSAYMWSVEKTTGANLGHQQESFEDTYNRYPQWEHLSTNVKMIFNGSSQRATTIRTGILSFLDENAGPRRHYVNQDKDVPLGDEEIYDENTTDPNVLRHINAKYDQLLNTKYNHPLLSIKTPSQRPIIKYHRFEKFTIGNDVSTNLDSNGIQVRKDYVIGGQGFLSGTKPSSYVKEVSNVVLDKNIQQQTVNASFLKPLTEFNSSTNPTGEIIVQAAGNVRIDNIPLQVGGYPPVATPPNFVGALNMGAPFPCQSALTNSSLFCHRKRDRWFFVQADYFMPNITNKDKDGNLIGLGSATCIPLDIGNPGTDAAYLQACNLNMQANNYRGFPPQSTPQILPASFDFVIQNKFAVRTVIDNNIYK